MTSLNPVDVFRMEADELLACLETTLLDLGEKPQDRDLIDTAFRALHTIKGSGAMFGFERVAAFTHDFETAFDLVRQGRVPASLDLVNVALSAKDYIRLLIEDPDGAEPVFGQAILDEAIPRFMALEEEMLSPLSLVERETLSALMAKVVLSMFDSKLQPPAGPAKNSRKTS